MKFIFLSIMALAIGFTSNAKALDGSSIVNATQPVEIPAELTDVEALVQFVESTPVLGTTVLGTELVWLDAQTKYFEIMRASFEGSRAMSNAFDAKAAQSGLNAGSATVTVVLDAFIAKRWLTGAAPTIAIVKDIYAASRGNTSRLSAAGAKTWASLMEIGKSLKIPKNFIATAAFGTFAYIQVENFFVINMSEAQYAAVIASLDAKITALQVRKANISDKHLPLSAR